MVDGDVVIGGSSLRMISLAAYARGKSVLTTVADALTLYTWIIEQHSKGKVLAIVDEQTRTMELIDIGWIKEGKDHAADTGSTTGE